jgi:LysR family carnitine catabolism transcriptional activator
MNVTVKQLRAFAEIAASGSFADAAERLHLSQPALSAAIRKLEEAAGGPLFARSTRRVRLTPEGEAFYPVAKRLLNDWSEAFGDLEELFSKQRGKVTLAALPTLAAGLLPPVLAQFRRQHPRINLSVHDVLAEQVTAMVREGRADIGLSVQPRQVDDIGFEPLLRDRFVVVCPLGHPLLEQSEVRWESLGNYPFIGISPLSSTQQAIDRTMAECEIELDTLCEVGQIATAARLVAAGLGVSVLPSLSFLQVSAEGIDYRPLIGPDVPRTLGIITVSQIPMSSAATAMLEMIRHIGSRLQTGSTINGERRG